MSKLNLLILGLINEKSQNPYELIKKIDKMKQVYWLPFAESSIYLTIKRLESKNLIEGTIIKENRFPAKTIYSLTIEGEKKFLKLIENSLLSIEGDLDLINISALFLNNLSNDALSNILLKKINMLETIDNNLKKKYDVYKSELLFNPVAISTIEHNLKRIKMNIEYNKEILNSINER
jgi:DNA-binding PadR family transcriptional regulator